MAEPDSKIEIRGVQGGGRTDYEIESTGPVYPVQVNNSDNVREKNAAGHVNGGSDIIGFDGHLKGIKFGSNARSDGDNIGEYEIYVDGQRKWPWHLAMGEVVLTTEADSMPYRLSVTGKLFGTGSTTGEDAFSPERNVVEGLVQNGGEDRYYFTGNLTSWPDWNQEGTVVVNGKERTYGGAPRKPVF